MRNRNEPSGAYAAAIYSDQDCPVQFVGGAEGLTKREEAAIAAMQGLIMRDTAVLPGKTGEEIHAAGQMRQRLRAKVAVAEADALFDELEKDDAKG